MPRRIKPGKAGTYPVSKMHNLHMTRLSDLDRMVDLAGTNPPVYPTRVIVVQRVWEYVGFTWIDIGDAEPGDQDR